MWDDDLDCIFEGKSKKLKTINEFDDELGDDDFSLDEPIVDNSLSDEDEILNNFNSSEDEFTSKVRSRLKFDPSKYSKKRINKKLFGAADFNLELPSIKSDVNDVDVDDDDFDLGI